LGNICNEEDFNEETPDLESVVRYLIKEEGLIELIYNEDVEILKIEQCD
jgi:hypothetical protein